MALNNVMSYHGCSCIVLIRGILMSHGMYIQRVVAIAFLYFLNGWKISGGFTSLCTRALKIRLTILENT